MEGRVTGARKTRAGAKCGDGEHRARAAGAGACAPCSAQAQAGVTRLWKEWTWEHRACSKKAWTEAGAELGTSGRNTRGVRG